MRGRQMPPQALDSAKAEIRGIVRAGRKVDELSDEALFILGLLVQKELQRRESRLARRGRDPSQHLVD